MESFKYLTHYGLQIVKGIDAVTREQLVRIMSLLGVQNASPIFGMVPTIGRFRPAALIPTITEEDKVILNNVQKVLEFLTAGSSLSSTSSQVMQNLLLKIICLTFGLEKFFFSNKQMHTYLLIYFSLIRFNTLIYLSVCWWP
jgi:hypothetical protein